MMMDRSHRSDCFSRYSGYIREQLPSVNIDYHEAAYEAVNRLFKIIINESRSFLVPLSSTINRAFKFTGYEKALEDAGIEIDEDLIVESEDTYDDGHAALK